LGLILLEETEKKKRRQAQLMVQREIVTKFFWDELPVKVPFEDREGLAGRWHLKITRCHHKNNQHIAVDAGVGIGKSFANTVRCWKYAKKPVCHRDC
jgi:ATP-dependent DNA helicase DinG